MKRIWFISISIIVCALVFFFQTPTINISHAQDCTSDPSVCGPGQTCVDINGEGKHSECQTPPPPVGSGCKTNEDKCAINQICSPNSPGSEDGTCKVISEGTPCNPNLKMADGRSVACGSYVTSDYECKPDATAGGGNTCQKVGCDLLEVGQPCEGKTNYYCVEIEGGKGACKFSTNPPALPTSPGPPCAKGQFNTADGKCKAFSTGVGILATDPAGFVRSVFGILLAASGAIAILLIIRAGYKILTSQGKPEAIQEGRERLVSAIVGLLFLIFALVFLELIGVDLLKAPEFSGASNTPIKKGGECIIGGKPGCADGKTCFNKPDSKIGEKGTCQ